MYGPSVFYFHFITRPGFKTDRVVFFSSVVRFRLVILVFFLVFRLLVRFFPHHQIFPTEVTIFLVAFSSCNLILFSVVRIACFTWNTFIVLQVFLR